jgi:L-alanine-DL-glutamate epimerase-like enolase superfamily enzyme
MKITDIRLHMVELPGRKAGAHQLIQVPTVRRTQYTHQWQASDEPAREAILRVQTDAGIEGLCTGGSPEMVKLLRANVLGMDALDRERIFQKLHLGTRWLYQRPGWFGTFDNCLWDIAGKAANLPVWALMGRARDSIPVYQTAGDGPVETYIEHIEQGKALGIHAYKPHSYKGGKADIPIMIKLREHVGPNFDLILDPVCSYTLREAIEIGHLLEELDFVWLEEPFHEYKMNLYQELCAELTIPVMANETFQHDMGVSAQWLIQGATDRVRATGHFGATQVLKLAHLAELYGTNIEINGTGGLYGLINVTLECCILNTDFYEYGVGGGAHKMGVEVGMLNPPAVVDGCLTPPNGPGWGAEWDLAYLEKHSATVV